MDFELTVTQFNTLVINFECHPYSFNFLVFLSLTALSFSMLSCKKKINENFIKIEKEIGREVRER